MSSALGCADEVAVELGMFVLGHLIDLALPKQPSSAAKAGRPRVRSQRMSSHLLSLLVLAAPVVFTSSESSI